MGKCTRRLFCAGLLSGLSGLLFLPSYITEAGAFAVTETPFVRARGLFARSIAEHRNGNQEKAKQCAAECLELLAQFESAEDTAAGEVVAAGGHVICEPSYLHVDTALQRFRYEGIVT